MAATLIGDFADMLFAFVVIAAVLMFIFGIPLVAAWYCGKAFDDERCQCGSGTNAECPMHGDSAKGL